MRQRIFEDGNGNLCGEYPHDPAVGFVRSKRGLRRRLVSAAERDRIGGDKAAQLAMRRYSEVENQIRGNQFANSDKERKQAAARRVMTVAEVAAAWLADIEHVSKSKTITMYRWSLDLYLRLVGNHPLREFGRDHNLQFMKALAKQSSQRHPGQLISVNTQEMHLRHFGIFLRWAYDAEYLDKQYRLKKPKKPQQEMETFSVDQLQALKRFLAANIDQAASRPEMSARQQRELVTAKNLYRAFMMATNALLRVGAIAHLPLENIDMDGQLLKIRDVPELGWKNKASKWPNKPINTQLLAFLQDDLAARSHRERWFLDDGNGNPWYADVSHVSKSMRRACDLAGLPGGVKPFHWGMRATLITWLLNNGESPQKVQQLADHSSIQTTMKYYNTRQAQQRDAVDRLPTI